MEIRFDYKLSISQAPQKLSPTELHSACPIIMIRVRPILEGYLALPRITGSNIPPNSPRDAL